MRKIKFPLVRMSRLFSPAISFSRYNYTQRKVFYSRFFHSTTSTRSHAMFPQPSPSRQEELTQAYNNVLQEVTKTSSRPVRLVAVTKLKPSSDIMALYNIGVRHFGENYVQELITKSQELPKDIQWHFIGGLQTGKCKDLAKSIDNLYAVEAVDSLKKCKKLDSVRHSLEGAQIQIYLQVNTSGEEQKSGYSVSDLSDIEETVGYLTSLECKTLKLQGLMTIGSFSESTADVEENQDFAKLVELKNKLDEKFSLDLELSMGMSNDYIQAIKQGSTNVRVGSLILGARPPRT